MAALHRPHWTQRKAALHKPHLRQREPQSPCQSSQHSCPSQNESDVFKWVIRKQFQELHRYVDEEKARFLERAEREAAHLISAIEAQLMQAAGALRKLEELEESLEKLNSEGQLDFVRVRLPPCPVPPSKAGPRRFGD